MTNVLARLKHLLLKSALLKLYYSFIYPYLSYCIIVWGCADKKYLHRISVLQNKAMRFVTNSKLTCNLNKLYTSCNCLKLEDIYMFNLLQFFFKLKYKLLPNNFNDNIRLYDTAVNYALRSNILHDFARTSMRKKHPFCAGPVNWDTLPVSLKSICTFNKFKRDVFTNLMSKYSND